MNTVDKIRQLREKKNQGGAGLAVFGSDDMKLKTEQPHFSTLERAADGNPSFGELKHRAEQMMDEVKNAMEKIETLKGDLESMTSQRDRLQAGIKDMQESMKREIAIRDADIAILKDELRCATYVRETTADLLLISFSQIYSLEHAIKRRDKGLLDIRQRKTRMTQPATCCRWVSALVSLCLFMGVTLYANQDDVAPLIDDATESQMEVISNISEYTEPTNISKYAEPSYYKAIKNASARYALDPNLIASIIYVESRGNNLAVSHKGAKGLMQLTPAVYKQYNADPFDIEQNIFSGTAHLASLLQKFDGNLEKALAAYNCGPTRVIEYKGIPPIKETQEYVERIMEVYLRRETPTGFANQDS